MGLRTLSQLWAILRPTRRPSTLSWPKPTAVRYRLGTMRLSHVSLFILALGLLGCDEPPADDFSREGGTAPDPTGVIEGSVLYIGPQPHCEWNGDTPKRVIGRVILTMFEYDNPPPPAGSATSAANFLARPGEELFSNLSADCRKEGETPEIITRTIPFVWPEITLYPDTPVAYQIRGFYDADEDMNPFFSVTNLPTKGDIAGAALVDVSDPTKGYFKIEFPSQKAAPSGAVRSSIAVTLAAPVWSERPMFKLKDVNGAPPVLPADRAASSYLASRIFAVDDQMDEDLFFEIAQVEIETLTTDTFPTSAQDASGLKLDPNDEGYAFFVEPIDVDGDGAVDDHPVLYKFNYKWYTPIVLYQRQADVGAEATEKTANIPSVTIVGTVLRRDAELSGVRAKKPSIQIGTPPIAVATWAPSDVCRAAYFPPGSDPAAWANVGATCQELPTGRYKVNVLGGIAGGSPVTSGQSDTGFTADGASSSGQAWSVPNELGSAEQMNCGPNSDTKRSCDGLVLSHQGRAGMLSVVDSDPTMVGRDYPEAGSATGSTGVSCDGAEMAPDLPADCCTSIAHLCDVPLCEKTDGIAASPTRIVSTASNGFGVPDCIPYPMPTTCCPAP